MRRSLRELTAISSHPCRLSRAPVHGGVDAFGTSLSGRVVSLDATLIDPECSTSRGLCAYWFSVYAALEGLGEVPLGGKTLALAGAGDALDFDSGTRGARLQLLVPSGATVTSVISGQGYPWISPVPEPSSAALLLGGLALGAAAAMATKARPRERQLRFGPAGARSVPPGVAAAIRRDADC